MIDYFELLGLPRRFAVDAAALERRYLELSREVHPDRGGGAAAAGQAMSLNQAYRALKRELPRAEHMLELAGVSIGDNEPVKSELLHEMLELREALAEAKSHGDRAALDAMERGARQRERAELDRLAELFAELEALPAGTLAHAERLAAIKDSIITLRYLARYREAFDEDAEAA